MEKLEVKVLVAKETYELGQGLYMFVAAMKKALDDGFQVGKDIPPILASAVADLVPAVQGAEKIGDETKDPEAFSDAIYLGIKPIPFLFIEQDEQPKPAA